MKPTQKKWHVKKGLAFMILPQLLVFLIFMNLSKEDQREHGFKYFLAGNAGTLIGLATFSHRYLQNVHY